MKRTLHPFLLALFFLPTLACATLNATAVTGSGEIVTRTIDVSRFDVVTLAASGDVYIEQGNTESLTIEADDNILPLLRNRVIAGELILDTRPNQSLTPSQPIIYRLTVKDLSRLTLNGSGNFFIDPLEAKMIEISLGGSGNISFEDLTAEKVSIELKGSGNIDIEELAADQIETSMPGSGNITLNGQAALQDVSISGSGSYRAADLETARAEIKIPGSADVFVWVLEELNTDVDGSGEIHYFGSPTIHESGLGSGNLSSLGEK
jgi:hypothetical protein